MNFPYETEAYYRKQIEEGIAVETFKNKLDEIPKLNYRNQIALEIWNIMQSINNTNINEAIEFLNLKLSKIEKYFIIHKIMYIKKIIDEFTRKEIERPIKDNYVRFDNGS